MPEIFLDGEPVQSDGPAPPSWEALVSAIEHRLAAVGRVVCGLKIDGEPNDGSLDEGAFIAARRIEIISLSLDEAIAQVASACRSKAIELRGVSVGLSAEILRIPWNEAAPQLVSLGERLAGLLQELDSLRDAPGFGHLSGELEAALHLWMDAVASRDAGEVCLNMERSLVTILERIGSSAGGRLKGDCA